MAPTDYWPHFQRNIIYYYQFKTGINILMQIKRKMVDLIYLNPYIDAHRMVQISEHVKTFLSMFACPKSTTHSFI